MAHLSSETLHATCVAIGDDAILIIGHSGSGKSDLALRLIDRGAILVSDDYTIVQRKNDMLIASAPTIIRGKIEVYGIGIIEVESKQNVPVSLIITLQEPVERMPLTLAVQHVAGIAVPIISLSPYEPSAPLKVEYAVKSVHGKKGF